MIFRRKNARSRGEFRPSDLSTNGAWRNRYTRIVANPLTLAHVAARHHVKFAVLFSEPDRSGNADAGFAERSERYVFLTSNLRGNLTRHSWFSRRSRFADEPFAVIGGSLRAPPIAPVLSSVLQA
jgi:hypothetical protein